MLRGRGRGFRPAAPEAEGDAAGADQDEGARLGSFAAAGVSRPAAARPTTATCAANGHYADILKTHVNWALATVYIGKPKCIGASGRKDSGQVGSIVGETGGLATTAVPGLKHVK